jgi:signal transduction histidine kinase
MSELCAARRQRCAALLGLALSFGSSPPPAAPEAPPPAPWRVLVLYSSPLDVPATAELAGALHSALSEGAAPRYVTIQSEVIDDLRFDVADYEAELVALFRKKQYAGRLDLLMTVGSTALFARRHYEAMWPGVPVVSFGASRSFLAENKVTASSTGVAFAFDEAGTLRLARRLSPDAERLVLVTGHSSYDHSWWPSLEAAAAREGGGLRLERLFDRPLLEVLDHVSHLPRRSIVLYATFSRDPDGEVFTPAIVAEQLSQASVAPVYSMLESQLGRGVVGGSMQSIVAHARQVADVALRVLHGTPAETIPIAPPPAPVPMLDWRQLRRFGLSEAALPAGSVVRYRPLSFVREHPVAAAAVGLALAVQTGLIVALLVQARQRKRAEAEAARQRADLVHTARLSAVGELVASIAHEINQPLGAILSNAEAAEILLEADPPGLDKVRRILGDIREEDQRASAVIRQVRAISRKQSPGTAPLDLNAVVADVVALVGADGRRRGVAVATDLEPGLPMVNGDRTQLQQVVLNLAINALDAVGPTGPGARRVRIRTRASDGGIELSVSDTGPGIEAEHLHRLFESFFTTKAEGLGIGLSIVRSIVEAHGGRVTAENNAGPGATFRVRLPAVRQEV